MNVLSLFDGMSCGQLALLRAGFNVKKYYASEIDVHAIKIAKKNFPNTQHVGSVTNLRIPKGEIIDLLIGGSPCQGFSFAGKQLNFNDERSKLFFEYVRILKEARHYNPDVKFLLENVKMKKEYQDVISEILGVQPIEINSALVSAQNRRRLYWTNIEGVGQPEDKGLFIEDILQDKSLVPVIKQKGELIYKPHKSQCLDANYFKGVDNHGQRTGCIEVGHAIINGHDFLKRVYSTKGKAPTLTAVSGGNQERKISIDSNKWRKLTPIECERLQTLPDNYTEGVSNTQRYKMIGNGWTVDVITHILSYYK
jgi:DNA-cytosine methyltransferase